MHVNADLVFVVAGLGGGIGSGSLSPIVKWVKQQGSQVIILAAMPFEFEGERRTALARATLQQLKKENDSIFVFSAQHLAGLGWHEGEKASDKLGKVQLAMVSCIWGLIQLVTKKGLVFSETSEVLKAIQVVSQAQCDQGGFAWSSGHGSKAIEKALEEVSKSEWLRGAAGTVREVLVAILGGPQLSLAEVKKITEFLKQSLGNDTTHFVFTAILEETYKGEVKLFVWTADSILPDNIVNPIATTLNLMAEEAVEANVSLEEKQEAFAFEAPNRGRFEKTDATFYHGENLDTPTFLRKKVKIR